MRGDKKTGVGKGQSQEEHPEDFAKNESDFSRFIKKAFSIPDTK